MKFNMTEDFKSDNWILRDYRRLAALDESVEITKDNIDESIVSRIAGRNYLEKEQVIEALLGDENLKENTDLYETVRGVNESYNKIANKVLQAIQNYGIEDFIDYYGYDGDHSEKEAALEYFMDEMSQEGDLLIPRKFAQDPDNVEDDEAYAYFDVVIRDNDLITKVDKLIEKITLDVNMNE